MGRGQGQWYTDDVCVVRKTITFTGAANLGAQGAVPLFTTTGKVVVERIMGFVSTNLAGANATLALGVTGATTLFIGATTATNMTATNGLWESTTPTAGGLALPAALKDIGIMANIIGTVATADVTGGVLTVWVQYRPVSSDGKLVAA